MKGQEYRPIWLYNKNTIRKEQFDEKDKSERVAAAGYGLP